MTPNDPHWLDRMYNNRALVPGFAGHLQHWSAASATARQTQPCHLDVRYGEGLNETLDVFPAHRPGAQGGAQTTARTQARAGAPVLVFIHGGYWRSLDKAEHAFIAPAFTQAGACVVIANYALCPGDATQPVRVTDITLQMVKALAWTYRHIEEYGGDPSRITVVGHSAGGHLAAMLLACVWKAYGRDLPAALVKNALSISGLYELASIRQTPYLQESLKLTPAQVKKASPAWLPRPKVSGGRGALYTVAGGDESAEFLRHNALIRASWGAAAVPVCEALPGLNHFSILDALVQPGHRLNQLALQALG